MAVRGCMVTSTKLPEGVGRGKRGKLLFDNWKNYKIKQKCAFSFSTFFFLHLKEIMMRSDR